MRNPSLRPLLIHGALCEILPVHFSSRPTENVGNFPLGQPPLVFPGERLAFKTNDGALEPSDGFDLEVLSGSYLGIL